MAARVRLNSFLERDIARDLGVRAALHRKGQEVVTEATRTGREVASSYQAEVEETVEGVRVVARTRGISAAGWIEFGTSKLTARAPLRKGAQSAGLNLRAR